MINENKTIHHNYNPITGEWNDSLVGEFPWSNVNISEAMPDVMISNTWFLWQIYQQRIPKFVAETSGWCETGSAWTADVVL